MQMKERLAYLLPIAAVVVAFASSWRVASAKDWTEVTVVLDQRMNRYPTGEAAKSSKRMVAVRADGSHVEAGLFDAPDGAQYSIRRVSDASLNRRTTVDESTGSVTTYPLAPGVAVLDGKPDRSACIGLFGAERSAILGYEVVKVVKSFTLPGAPERRIVTWMAPALDCLPLKATTYMGLPEGNETSVAVFEREATDIFLGSPDPVLFEIPADFTERRPSDAAQERSRKFFDKPEECRMDAADQAHDISQQSKRVRE